MARRPRPPWQAQVASSAHMQMGFWQEAARLGPAQPLQHSPHSCPREAGQAGEVWPSSAGRRCSRKAGCPAPCGFWQAGLLAAARGHSSGQPCTPPLLFWGLRAPFPISQGTIPAPGSKAGLPGAPGSRSVLPRGPLPLCWSRRSPWQDRGPGPLPLHATAPPSGMRGARPGRAHT